MNCYLDTSFVVAALAPEACTVSAQAWLARQLPGSLHISDWTLTEFSSAMSIKIRSGQLSLDQRAEIVAVWQNLILDSLHVSKLRPEHFELAAQFAANHELGVRAGDALHLAVAHRAGYHIVTLDVQMARAARLLGIAQVQFPEVTATPVP